MADPVTDLGQYLWSHGGEIWINVIAILISAGIGWLIYSFLRRLAKRVEDSLERIPERLSGRKCAKCDGNKVVGCEVCHGKGSNPKVVKQDVVCSGCKGLKKVDVTCPGCSGAGSVPRLLSFKPLGISAVTRFSFSPFGHVEYVNVRIQNTDKEAGTFTILTALGDARSSSAKGQRTLASGAIGTFPFEFKVHGSTCYPARFEVTPPEVIEQCSQCGGRRQISVKCPDCSGLGTVPQTTTVDEPCASCGGVGTVKCAECKGEGRIPGLFG